ncbi:MAG TPA: ATP synthase subunit I [Acidimicrobiales bacterium]
MTEDLLQRVDAPAVERQLAMDMARRGLLVAPVLIAVATAVWGIHGGLSAAFAVALALGNLLLAAVLVSWAARISLLAMAAVALGGYLARLVLLTAVVFAVRHQPWVSWIPLALTLLVTHLGLLLWETRYVSASLAYPGLKPNAPHAQKGR